MKFYQDWMACIHDETMAPEYFPAVVPGNVQKDFARYMGWLADLQFATNIKKLEPYRNCYWKYETTLEYTANPGERVYFVAEGIDYEFDILLDGEKLWHQEGMYTPVELDVTEKARPGSVLAVILYPHPSAPGATPFTREEARESCKPPVTYSWDWNPFLPISGLWKPAYVETRTADYIRSCEPFYTLDVETKTADIWFETDCGAPVEYTLWDAEGNVLYTGTEGKISLTDVHLWWCNGQGEPYLYRWSAKTPGDEKTGRIGLRTVRLVKNEGTMDEPAEFPKGRYPAPITVELNGRRIFGKGSNWVNNELFFGDFTKERYEEQIVAAKEANMNLFRIWGGSGIGKDEFFELCDEHGIMVWQEFMLACNEYPNKDHYLSVLEKEATWIVKHLRRHACIVLWCGGNELFNGWSAMDDQSLPLRLLNKICYEHDRSRAFLYTSPLTGMAHGCYLFRYEDGRDVFEVLPTAHHTAYTEFGVPGMADPENLRKIIPEDELFPLRKTENWVYHHAFEAWGDERWSCPSTVEHYFGEVNSIEEYCEKTDWMQSAGYQAIFEESRRQWPYCSMALNWCYNEPWICAANNSLIAYPNKPKPAYYAVKNALRSSIPTARIPRFDWKSGDLFTAQLWYVNDAPETVNDTVKVSVILGEEEFEMFTWETGNVAERTNKVGPSVNLHLPKVKNTDKLVLKLTSAHTGRSNEYTLRYYYKEPPKRTLQLNV